MKGLGEGALRVGGLAAEAPAEADAGATPEARAQADGQEALLAGPGPAVLLEAPGMTAACLPLTGGTPDLRLLVPHDRTALVPAACCLMGEAQLHVFPCKLPETHRSHPPPPYLPYFASFGLRAP